MEYSEKIEGGVCAAGGAAAARPTKWHIFRNMLDIFDVWLSRHLNRTPATLPVLVVMVTDKCNLKCKMCGACDYSLGDHNMLSLEEWKAVVASAAKLKTKIVSITGGEAMLRRDLFDLIRHIRAQGMAVHLNTNGLLLTHKNIAMIRDAGVETVSISFESSEPEVHDAVRGAGMFERTLEGLPRLRTEAPEVRIGLNCVINKWNVETLPAMVDFAAAEGVNQVKFAPIHTNLQHKDKPVSDYESMIFQETDMEALDRQLGLVQEKLAGTELQSTSKAFFDGIPELYKAPASNFYCYAGYAISTINAQGYVAACFDKDSRFNVREQPLDRIWKSAGFHEHRQLVRHCEKACWDTTNAELSLRLSFGNLFRDTVETARLVKFYLSRKQ